MIAGTSTGAIIAVGLSVLYVHHVHEEIECTPSSDGNSYQEKSIETLSPYQPRYSAFDMVQLYREKSREIFTTPGWGWIRFQLGKK